MNLKTKKNRTIDIAKIYIYAANINTNRKTNISFQLYVSIKILYQKIIYEKYNIIIKKLVIFKKNLKKKYPK